MYSDRHLALCELAEDPLFQRIPSGRVAHYVDGSLEAGRAAAAGYAGRDVFELYREHGIALDIHPGRGGLLGVVLRGQATMDRDECRVEVYEASVRALAENAEGVGYENALRTHLAHEFFHVWEYRNGTSIAESLGRVETFRFFGLVRRSPIGRCCEVAAHVFAKELLRLPCLPNLYDYQYLIGIGKMRKEDFEARMEELNSLLG